MPLPTNRPMRRRRRSPRRHPTSRHRHRHPSAKTASRPVAGNENRAAAIAAPPRVWATRKRRSCLLRLHPEDEKENRDDDDECDQFFSVLGIAPCGRARGSPLFDRFSVAKQDVPNVIGAGLNAGRELAALETRQDPVLDDE